MLGLGAVMLLATVSFLVLGRDLTFWSDELDWLTYGDDFVPSTLLAPHGGNLTALPRAVYELLPRLFGSEYLPFRLVTFAALLAGAALLFVLVRRRVGGPAALAAAATVLFFGSAPDVALSAVGMPTTFSTAFGLGAYLAFERGSRRADVGGFVLLLLSILSHSLGPILAGGAAVYLLSDPGRRSRAWAVLVPLAFWIGWFVWARKFDQGIADSSNLLGAPAFVAEAAGAAFASALGIGTTFEGWAEFFKPVAPAFFAIAALAGTGLLVRRARRTGASPWLPALAATAVGFWLATALAESEVRQPTTPRYVFFGATIAILFAAEALRGWRPPRRWLGPVAAVLVIAVGLNATRLVIKSERLREQANEVAVQLAAIELAGPPADAAFSPRAAGPPGSKHIATPAPALVRFAASYGTLGASPEGLAAASDAHRRGVDFVLARASGAFAAPAPAGEQVELTSCGRFDSRERFPLPNGVSLIRTESGGQLLIGRFADSASVRMGALGPAGGLALALPPVAGAGEWFGSAPGPAEVCTVEAGEPAG